MYICIYIYLFTYMYIYKYICIYIYILILIFEYINAFHAYIQGLSSPEIEGVSKAIQPKIEGKWGYPAQRFKEFEGP